MRGDCRKGRASRALAYLAKAIAYATGVLQGFRFHIVMAGLDEFVGRVAKEDTPSFSRDPHMRLSCR